MPTEKHFDIFTIWLHWSMAFVIFFLFGLGLYMVDLSYYDSWYKSSTALHKSVGLCLLVLLLIRICWRLKCLLTQKPKVFSAKLAWDMQLAKYVQISMYVLLALLCFSGYCIATAGQRNIEFFIFFSLPPLPIEIDNQEDIAGSWHYYIAWILMALVVLHVLGALKHHFINRDRVLINMIKPTKTKNGDS